MSFCWSPVVEHRLYELLTDPTTDRSSTLIARDLSREYGRITRCAVIGKLRRMGWSDLLRRGKPKPQRTNGHSYKPRAKMTKPALIPTRQFIPLGRRPLPSFPRSANDQDIPVDQRRQLLDLEIGQCRWPVGDPRFPEQFFFCGNGTVGERPYCRHHCRRAYVGWNGR